MWPRGLHGSGRFEFTWLGQTISASWLEFRAAGWGGILLVLLFFRDDSAAVRKQAVPGLQKLLEDVFQSASFLSVSPG